jgi:hypothetical protein
MQNPGQNPGYNPGYPPQRTGPPWGWIIGIGCGGCALIVLIGLVAAFMIGRSALKEVQEGTAPPGAYVGEWQAQGNVLTLNSDGSGDFKGGGVSVEGPARMDPKTGSLKIGLLGISKTFHVDQPPHQEGDATVMTLDGVVYRHSGASTPQTSSGGDSSGGGTAGSPGLTFSDGSTVPSEEQCRQLALKSLLDWNQGVQSRDFAAFQATTSKEFQDQIPLNQLSEKFKEFMDKHIDISPIRNYTPAFDPEPAIHSEGAPVLHLAGRYPTTPHAVSFDLKYVFQDSTWKILAINVQYHE